MKRNIATSFIILATVISQIAFVPSMFAAVSGSNTVAPAAQSTLNSGRPTVDITSGDFKVSVCDGPDLSKLKSGTTVTLNHAVYNSSTGKVENRVETFTSTGDGKTNPSWYKPCNFNGLMNTIQRFIDIAMVLGVFVALGSFCFIGYLYMTGAQENIKKAKSMLPKIFFGFIMMLAAWFIVYQILTWLGASAGFKTLLGNP